MVAFAGCIGVSILQGLWDGVEASMTHPYISWAWSTARTYYANDTPYLCVSSGRGPTNGDWFGRINGRLDGSRISRNDRFA